MDDVVIRVKNLGKLYRLGQTVGYKTLRESIANVFTAPLHRNRVVAPQSLRRSQQQAVGHGEDYIWALKDVSFEVKRGEILGIIGANGSGKSTLLKILTRITWPTEGHAEIRGRVGSLLEVGTGFHPELTGRENIYLNGAVLGMKKSEVERKFDEIVEFSGVEKFLDTPVKRYSSGMYVRLAFSVAAHLEPDILLVDEVLAVGDVAFQKKCLGKMGDATTEGRTVLFVSHSMVAIQELCPRAILLMDGRIVEDAPTGKVISVYLSRTSRVSEGDMDISDPALRRSSLEDSQFRWTRITIINSVGKATGLLKFGEPFEIILRGFSDCALSDIKAGFSIDSVLGVPLFNSFQVDDGIPGLLPSGEVGFRVSMDPNLLAPGQYTISLAAKGDGVIDWLPTTLQFRISEVGAQDAKAWQSYHGGMIRYPCKWRIERGGCNG